MKDKRVILVRYGAYGDCVILSPVIEKLHNDGWYIILNTGKRGQEVYKHDKRVNEIIPHDESTSHDDLIKHWEKLQKDIKHDKYINFSESLECNVAVHPVDPLYNQPKLIRQAFCNRNYYDVTSQWAEVDNCNKKPSLQFTQQEEEKVKGYIKKDKFNILWCMSGSGNNKAYPWTDYVIGDILKDNDVHVITVGDVKCQILENINQFPKDRVTQLAGKTSMRESMLLTKYVQLVISPDTGVLHAAGCFITPKIGLLGHTTIENITKYFDSDYSIEADCACAPCFRLIYDHGIQCPIDELNGACFCMSQGMIPERIYEQYKKVRADYTTQLSNLRESN